MLFQIKDLIEGGQVKINEVDENNVTALRNFILFFVSIFKVNYTSSQRF